MASDPTIYDIAKHAGVGIATVSRVLNGSERVSPHTRSVVQSAMSELGFRPNRAARRLAVRGPNRPRVAALMPLFSANFYFAVSEPLSKGLAEADLDLVLYNIQSRDDKNRVLDRLVREHSCEGLLLCSMGIGPERMVQFRNQAVPMVSLDFPIPGIPSVTVDNVAGGAKATRQLQRAGADHLGLISGPAAALAFRQREEGFISVAGSAAPVMRAEAVTIEAGRAAAAALLDAFPATDGIVTVNDLLAVGALSEARARGRLVPDDLQIIGFDDQPLMEVIGMSTVRQPMGEFGSWAAHAITALLARPANPSAAPVAVASAELPLSLVLRSTTRPAAGGRRAGGRPAPA
jgi:DNA-binding LacI/PurR family transcriptional regulator